MLSQLFNEFSEMEIEQMGGWLRDGARDSAGTPTPTMPSSLAASGGAARTAPKPAVGVPCMLPKLRVPGAGQPQPPMRAPCSLPMDIAVPRATPGSRVWSVPGPSPPPPSPFAVASLTAFPSSYLSSRGGSGSLGGFSVHSCGATPAAYSLPSSEPSSALAFAAAFSCVAEEQSCAVAAPAGLSWRQLAATGSCSSSGSGASTPRGSPPAHSPASGSWSPSASMLAGLGGVSLSPSAGRRTYSSAPASPCRKRKHGEVPVEHMLSGGHAAATASAPRPRSGPSFGEPGEPGWHRSLAVYSRSL